MNQEKVNIELLGEIIRKDYAAFEKHLTSGPFDWDDLARFIIGHHLGGYVYTVLRDAGMENLFPARVMEYFKKFYINQWAVCEKFMYELERIIESFSVSGPEVIFLKGPLFVQRFYGSPDYRSSRDVDILVREEDVRTAEDILIRGGYRRISSFFLCKSLTMHFTHHFEYKKQDIPLDLHWFLTTHPSYKLNYERIWKEKQTVSVNNRNFAVLSTEYELVFNVLSILGDFSLGTVIFKSFIDTYRITKEVENSMSWPGFFENRKQEAGRNLQNFSERS